MKTLIIRGAAVHAGLGGPPVEVDVACSGGRILEVAPRVRASGAKVLDASGLALAPGFIDIHGHTDMSIFRLPSAAGKVLQGVTTEVVGNCGIGCHPVSREYRGALAALLSLHGFCLPEGGLFWNDLPGWADRVEALPLALNLAPLTAHGALRLSVMGPGDRPPAPDELFRMEALLHRELRDGAWGLSTGLIYPPGSFALAPELIALARVCALRGALYASHIRGEGESLFSALAEAVALGRESGARVQVSHLKAIGAARWGRAAEALSVLSEARRAGVDIAADQYPYAASATSLSALLPEWAHDGGVSTLLLRLAPPGPPSGLLSATARAIAERGGPERIVLSGPTTPFGAWAPGESLAAVAARRGLSPEAAATRLIAEGGGTVMAVFHSLSEDDVSTIMADEMVAVGSDGHGLSPETDGGEAAHPRSYGTFPRVLGLYARERGVLTLPAAIRKMTSLPAARLGMPDRGRIGPGMAADLVLFDPARVRDCATFAAPHQFPEGVARVFVAGVEVAWEGRLTGNAPGRVLRRNRPAGSP